MVELAKAARVRPELFRGYEIQLYPLCNPTGYEDGTRHSRRGEDLNRQFWRGSTEPEVAILEHEIGARSFHGIVSLHADDTSDGVYGFVRGSTISRELPMTGSSTRGMREFSRPAKSSPVRLRSSSKPRLLLQRRLRWRQPPLRSKLSSAATAQCFLSGMPFEATRRRRDSRKEV